MADTDSGWSCHSCGDPVAENTIYCSDCSYVDSETESEVTEDPSGLTWEDVEGTRSALFANIAQLVLLLSFGALLLGAIGELIRKYAFGATDTSYFLLMGILFVLMIISFILNRTWTAFRLLGNE